MFTFSLTSKEMKAGKDPLINYRNRLEDLDIKVVIPYVLGVTTHVVGNKRNTAKGLQALINAKYIVTETYIDALVYATTPENLDELESLSPLEEDFDANWPNALEHLPAKSKEPSERPSEDFEPNNERGNVFEGYTFVFLDATQFETLQAPITNGGGKALSFIPDPGKTTTEEIVRYVKSVAGEKGMGEFEDGSEGKGVVVVRFRLKEKFADWAAQMDTTISLALGQRLIEQSEFIEAILLNDASILRRPLEVDYEESAPRTSEMLEPAAASTSAQDFVQVEAPAQSEASKPTRRRARARGNVTSRFKGFGADDDDDESSIPTFSRPTLVDSQKESAPRSGRSQRLSNGASLTDSVIDIESQNQENSEHEATNSRKRPALVLKEINEDEVMDNLLPAASAMKRRRIEEAKSSQRDGVSREPSFETPQNMNKKENTRQTPKEVNIKDVLREQREKEEAARRDAESPRETPEGMSIEAMKKLAVVETMDVPDRSETRPREHGGSPDSRWDERWNGRKNFKKFRRRGEGTQARRGQSVIVPLEEAKRKDYGIGDDYWLDNEKTKNKRKEKERGTQSQSQSQRYATAKSEVVEVFPELANHGDLPESIDVAAPRTTRRQERTQHMDESSGKSQAVNRKRPAGSQADGGPAKKQKTFAVQDSDSDSEDELKFRFKKKGR